MISPTRRIGIAALALVALITVSCGSDAAPAPRVLSGYQLTPAPSVAALSLPDASAGDAEFPFVASTGHLLLVYFGYTSCPDVCPTSLSDVKHALAAVAAGFGASYSVETNDDGEIEVGHSASIYVVDDTGTVVLTWPFGLPDEAMATDLGILFDQIEARP